MKNKKVRTSFYADEKTVRQMDWLARRLKISRSEVVERAIRLITRGRPALDTRSRTKH
jgi:predicted transcriptional regulator